MSQTLEEALISNFAEDDSSLLKNNRNIARSLFVKNGLPKFKEEEYKFTPIAKTLEKRFKFSGFSSGNTPSAVEVSQHFLDKEAVNLVFVNGKFAAELSSGTATEGVTVQNMAALTEDNSSTFLENYGKLEDNDAFTSLNSALTRDGAFISAKAGVQGEKVIYLYYFNTSEDTEAYSFPRNLVLAEKNSNVTVVEKNITLGSHSSFANIFTEVQVAQNAHIKHYRLQTDTQDSFEVSQTKVYQQRDSTYTAFTISLSGGMIRNNLNIISDGSNCQSNMYGLYMLEGKTHVDNHTSVDHREPNSESNELYKGIMDGNSKGVFNGKIFVRQEAQKTNAFQSNNNILLSDSATLNTKPQLEIWADDVKCSHGCTSGQLDYEAVFYLQARGISREKAIGMLLFAFANDILEKISVEPVADYLREIVENRLKY